MEHSLNGVVSLLLSIAGQKLVNCMKKKKTPAIVGVAPTIEGPELRKEAHGTSPILPGRVNINIEKITKV